MTLAASFLLPCKHKNILLGNSKIYSPEHNPNIIYPSHIGVQCWWLPVISMREMISPPGLSILMVCVLNLYQ